MSYRDQLLANQLHHERQGQALFERAQASMNTIRAELERRDRRTREAVEEALQRLEDSKSPAEKRAERSWSGGGQKFGNLVDEEPETGKLVRRAPRDDDSTRSFATERDAEEKQEPLPPRGEDWGGATLRVDARRESSDD